MKIITGMFCHESNTFSNLPTGMAEYRQHTWIEGPAIEQTFSGTKTSLGAFIDIACREGIELVYTIAANATPGGKVTDEVFERVWAAISRALDTHPDAHGVLLALHGAMVTESSDDGEGELLKRVRSKLGTERMLTATLDCHAHLTPLMTEQANILILYKTIPHVDMYERAVEAAELTVKSIGKGIRPVMALAKPPMTTVKQSSANSPTRDFMAQLVELEKTPEILSASMSMGFNYADVSEAGTGFLVVADGDGSLAKREAHALARNAWVRRHEFIPHIPDVPEAVDRAIALSREGHPVIIADGSDNPGGGTAGDSVAVLAEFVKRGVTGVAVSTVRDPEMVELAHQAGVGAVVNAELGGKTDTFHGPSLPVEARVRLLSDGRFIFKGRMFTGMEGNLGRTAVLEVAGNLVIVNENRQQTLDPELMRRQGVEPCDFRFVVLKSTMHYRSNFTELAHAIVEANGPGLSSARLRDFPRQKMRRPFFPLDDAFEWES